MPLAEAVTEKHPLNDVVQETDLAGRFQHGAPISFHSSLQRVSDTETRERDWNDYLN